MKNMHRKMRKVEGLVDQWIQVQLLQIGTCAVVDWDRRRTGRTPGGSIWIVMNDEGSPDDESPLSRLCKPNLRIQRDNCTCKHHSLSSILALALLALLLHIQTHLVFFHTLARYQDTNAQKRERKKRRMMKDGIDSLTASDQEQERHERAAQQK